MSIAIIDAFVAMRRFLIANGDVFRRIETVERRQIIDQVTNEERFKRVFKALDEKKEIAQGVFYDGQLWDTSNVLSGSLRIAASPECRERCRRSTPTSCSTGC